MRVETFSRVLRAMRPAVDRMSAEADLAHMRMAYRTLADQQATESLLDAAGGFYGRMSQYALDAKREDVYRLLTNAWASVALAYEAGEGLDDPTFKLYSIAVTHRIMAG
jgi:hypothetical protein